MASLENAIKKAVLGTMVNNRSDDSELEKIVAEAVEDIQLWELWVDEIDELPEPREEVNPSLLRAIKDEEVEDGRAEKLAGWVVAWGEWWPTRKQDALVLQMWETAEIYGQPGGLKPSSYAIGNTYKGDKQGAETLGPIDAPGELN